MRALRRAVKGGWTSTEYKRKLRQMYHSFSEMGPCALYWLIWGDDAAMRVRNKDSWHQWPPKTLDASTSTSTM